VNSRPFKVSERQPRNDENEKGDGRNHAAADKKAALLRGAVLANRSVKFVCGLVAAFFPFFQALVNYRCQRGWNLCPWMRQRRRAAGESGRDGFGFARVLVRILSAD
jgi:hypothetical protein